MKTKKRAWRDLVSSILFAGLSCTAAQVLAAAEPMITQRLDPGLTVALSGNTRPEANAGNDRGRVNDNKVFEHMQLQLHRSARSEAALKRFIASLHDVNSPNYHQWLSAQQFGATYGAAASDLAAIQSWLTKSGLRVNFVHANNMVIDFSGSAGQIRSAFKTEMHRFNVKGVEHIANMGDPQIPVALAPAVAGIVSLHNFRPHTNNKPKPDYTFSAGLSKYEAVTPADLATIYNLNPLFRAGITGRGQTIVVIEDTNVFSTADWSTFRDTFGLNAYSSTATLSQVHPSPFWGPNNCTDPGVIDGNESEAALDVEWASAGAPGADIKLASCADTETTFGGLIALQNLVNNIDPPAIVSISYGECEAYNGAAANAGYRHIYQQAVAEGTSIYVSSGDEGAASCDPGQTAAIHGIGVSGLASTSYNVAVGGTDFGDTYAKTTASYWDTTNSAVYGSALSYVPEIPWNNSCASSLISQVLGFPTTYGSGGFCNSLRGTSYFLSTASGSGGPSGCAFGTAAIDGVVSGNCRGYEKPDWQRVLGNPDDEVRDIPDVSLFAANGIWRHYYVYCDSDINDFGAPCTGAPSGWSGGGGTSFAAPIWAGFQALVNQHAKSRQGNPNERLYSLARKEYGKTGNAGCNSSLGNTSNASCVFYDVTLGDIDVNCTGTDQCYSPDGSANGVLSTSKKRYKPAYATGVGWDFATGIGTVNVTNLVYAW